MKDTLAVLRSVRGKIEAQKGMANAGEDDDTPTSSETLKGKIERPPTFANALKFLYRSLIQPLIAVQEGNLELSQEPANSLGALVIELDERLAVGYSSGGEGWRSIKEDLNNFHLLLDSRGLGERGQERWSSMSIQRVCSALFGPVVASSLEECHRLLGEESQALWRVAADNGHLIDHKIKKDAINMLKQLKRAGRLGLDVVISNFESALPVVQTALLMKAVAGHYPPVQIIPLFESAKGVRRAPEVMSRLAGLGNFIRPLMAANKRLVVMFGPSDLMVEVGALAAHVMLMKSFKGCVQVFRSCGGWLKTGVELGLGSSRGRLGGYPNTLPATPEGAHSIRTAQGWTATTDDMDPVSLVRRFAARLILYMAPELVKSMPSFDDISELENLARTREAPWSRLWRKVTGTGGFNLWQAAAEAHKTGVQDARLKSWLESVGDLDTIRAIAPLLSSRPPKRPSDDQVGPQVEFCDAAPLANTRAVPIQQIGQNGSQFINVVGVGAVLSEAITAVGEKTLQDLFQDNETFRLHMLRLAEAANYVDLKAIWARFNAIEASISKENRGEELQNQWQEKLAAAKNYPRCVERDYSKLVTALKQIIDIDILDPGAVRGDRSSTGDNKSATLLQSEKEGTEASAPLSQGGKNPNEPVLGRWHYYLGARQPLVDYVVRMAAANPNPTIEEEIKRAGHWFGVITEIYKGGA